MICTHSPAFSVNDKPLIRFVHPARKVTLWLQAYPRKTLLKTWLDFAHIGQLVRYPLWQSIQVCPSFTAWSCIFAAPISGRLYPYTRSCDNYGTPAVVVLHAPPLILCHRQAMSFNFCGVSITPKILPYSSLLALACVSSLAQTRAERDNPDRSQDAATVVVVHGIHVFLIHRVSISWQLMQNSSVLAFSIPVLSRPRRRCHRQNRSTAASPAPTAGGTPPFPQALNQTRLTVKFPIITSYFP